MTEEWKPAPGWTSYEVSSLGRVRRVDSGRVLPNTVDKDGYVQVFLSMRPRRRHVRVHRLVLFAFHGEPPSAKHETRHLDGSRTNATAANLCWGTKAENTDDRAIHNPTCWRPKGEAHRHSVLTDAIVLDARRRAEAGESVKEIWGGAKEYSYRALADAVAGKSWRHLTPEKDAP